MVSDRISKLMKSLRMRNVMRGVQLVLSALVVGVLVFALRQTGIAQSTMVSVLDCHVSGNVAHTHNEDCYDEEGNLVCTLPEVALHTHTDECYEISRNLICGLEESEEHTHTDECYEETRTLICGLEEVTEEHVHDDSCFRTVTVPADATSSVPELLESSNDTLYPAQSFEHVFEDDAGKTVMVVRVESPEGALPAGSVMDATWVDAAKISDKQSEAIDRALGERTDGVILDMQAVDITFHDEAGVVVEPRLDVKVTFVSDLGRRDDDTYVVHMDDLTESEQKRMDEGDPEPERVAQVQDQIQTENADSGEVTFESQRFSTYYLAVTSSDTSMESVGDDYTVRLDAGANAGLSQTAQLDVTDLTGDETAVSAYVAGMSSLFTGDVEVLRLLDISISDSGAKVEPVSGSNVDVSIDFSDPVPEGVQVVHFGDAPETVSSDVSGSRVSFRSDSFSVYALVTLPEIEDTDDEGVYVADVSDLDGNDYYLSVTKNGSRNTFYFMNTIVEGDKIQKTPANAVNAASFWHFDLVEGTVNDFYLSVETDDGIRYMTMDNSGIMSLSETPVTALTIEKYANNVDAYYIYRKVGNSKYGLNMRRSEAGKGFSGWTGKDDGSCIYAFAPAPKPDDPLGLDGNSYAFINYSNGGISGVAMTTTPQTNNTRLKAQSVVIRSNPLTDGTFYVAKNVDIPFFTFHSLGEDKYHITAEVDGQTKYLRITSNSVTLVDEPDKYCDLYVKSGFDVRPDRIRISNIDGYSPNLYNGSVGNGFGAKNDAGNNEWFALAERSGLDDSDFIPYTAHKVSVSDRLNVYDGVGVVIYTRVWNDTAKRYDIYAVDHMGKLVPAYENGDVIQWIGLRVNNMLWDFTEYTDAVTGLPNDYYELQNIYSGRYLAPNHSSDTLLPTVPVGISLEGRRLGEYHTDILAWDDFNYSYVGYKVEGDHLVACPLAEADSFYFATMTYVEEPVLTTVDTVNNNDYGIVMKMQDYNNAKIGTNNGYDSVQAAIMGGNNNDGKGLASRYLDDGYPVATATGRSLSELFNDASDVNHLFLQSTYAESGYFEYDSTSNFAHLNDDGNFTVYDQLGAIGDYPGATGTGTHGQFMPYDELTPGKYCTFTNRTDVLAHELPDTDPRKDEKLYNIGNRKQVDYHFGMEMSASFTQTADGLDAWGHDIIFEFSGDDDFWFYVDDLLVLDLGGVHSAQTGTINFRTGEIVSSRGNSTVRAEFKASYMAKTGCDDATAEAWLDTVFKPGTSVFADYTTHEMRMIYMERGAGASNLHMRFNLAAVKKGAFLLSKKLSGMDSESNTLLEYPYQVWYRTEEDGDYELLGKHVSERAGVVYKDSTRNVKYRSSYTPAGGSEAYRHVFFLKPGEVAEVMLPPETIDYYVVECGLNMTVYDSVMVNGEAVEGTESANMSGGIARQDFATEIDTLQQRASVEYDNVVREGASGSLSLTKRLYDSDGVTELDADDDSARFSFRLYLGDENESLADLPLARFYPYYVKAPDGAYCRWDASSQSFVSLGVYTHEDLVNYFEANNWSAAQKETVIFRTSMYGAISKIPVGYTVEVRDLIAGTKYEVEEREGEIPRGYTLRAGDGYCTAETISGIRTVTPNYNENTGVCDPVIGIMGINDNPDVEVRNQRGWGLTVKKVWTDRGFMTSRDDVYFGVFLDGEVVDGTLRAMGGNVSELYWFVSDLRDDEGVAHSFDEFEVREVELEGAVVDADGYVTSYDSMNVLEHGDTTDVSGVAVGSSELADYHYTVYYDKGRTTGHNENIRTDTITNSRPGIAFYKSDFTGNVVVGARFTLTTAEGVDVADSSYLSDETGLITTAYLADGDYLLSEVSAPNGYTILDEPLVIHVSGSGENQQVSVDGLDPRYYSVLEGADGMQVVIHIKNTPSSLQVRKVDQETGEGIPGAHFAVYRQVVDNVGHGIKDYYPMEGFEDVVSDENGVISELNMTSLGVGTYYLEETLAPTGYARLAHDVCVSIGNDGIVSVVTPEYRDWVSHYEDENGNVSYAISIKNRESMHKVRIKKVPVDNPLSGALEGAVFDLYPVVGGVRQNVPVWSGGTSGADGIVVSGGENTFELDEGTYHLVETSAPDGYSLRTTPVTILVGADGISYDDGTSVSLDGSGLTYDADSDTYTLCVTNAYAYELPSTGGFGSVPITILGIVISLLGVVVLRRSLRIA